MRKNKNSRGITLVALIITIIVLLILATVSISLVINTGIILKAENAVDDYKVAEEIEQIQLGYTNYKLAQTTEVQNNLNVEGATVTGNENSGWTVMFCNGGNQYTLDKNGKILPISSSEEQIVDDGETIISFYEGSMDSTCKFNTSKANNVKIFVDEENSDFYYAFYNECREAHNNDILQVFPSNILSQIPEEFNNMSEVNYFSINNYETRFGNALFNVCLETPYRDGEIVYVVIKYQDDSLQGGSGYIVIEGLGDSEGKVNFEMSSEDLIKINGKDSIFCMISQ